MFSKWDMLMGCLTAMAIVSTAPAQDKQASSRGDPGVPLVRVHPGGYGPGWGWYYEASTAAEGFLRGRAAELEAAGEFLRDSSVAANNFQEAHRRALENSTRRVDTYFHRRQLNEQYRAEMRGQPPTPAQVRKYAKATLPDRPAADQLNRVTGEIDWPATLAGKEFADYRKRLGDLFEQRSRESERGLDSEHYAEIKRVAKEMLSALKEHVKEMPPMQYIQARNFIESLQYEARFDLKASAAELAAQ